jgi:predicted ATPase
VAAEALEEFPDGVWLVELTALSDPNLVLKAIASVLSVLEQPGRVMIETLADSLRGKSMLVVLDNCEHLVEACAHLADALPRGCPNLRILATRREALGVTGETVWRVPRGPGGGTDAQETAKETQSIARIVGRIPWRVGQFSARNGSTLNEKQHRSLTCQASIFSKGPFAAD